MPPYKSVLDENNPQGNTGLGLRDPRTTHWLSLSALASMLHPDLSGLDALLELVCSALSRQNGTPAFCAQSLHVECVAQARSVGTDSRFHSAR